MSKRQTYRFRKAAKSARLVATGCISACVLPAAAQALAIPDPQEMEVELAISCPARPFEPAVSARPASPLELTKSAAILGGQTSALDRIRQQQTQLVPEPAAEVQLASVSQVPVSFANSCLAVTSQAPAPALAALLPLRHDVREGVTGPAAVLRERHTTHRDNATVPCQDSKVEMHA